MATLITQEGPQRGRQYEIGRGVAIIGRQPGCAIYLDSLAVSRQHARIVTEGDAIFIEDLGSSNGTFVNGMRVTGRVPLTEADTLDIGPYQLRLSGTSARTARESESIVRSRIDATGANPSFFLQNAANKLKVVVEIAQHLARTLEMDVLLGRLLEQLLRLFPQADRALVVMCEDDRLVLRAFRGRRANMTEGPYSRTVVQQALREGAGLLSDDVPTDPRIVKSATLVGLQLRSFMCVPMIAPGGERLGVVQLDCNMAGMAFREDDLELLTAVALQAAVVLENAALHAARLQEERLRQELALAREIQQGYLPTEFAAASRGAFDLYARVHPARQVSGDLYDFFPLKDGRLAFFVGDVSGKGMPAALFMVAVRTLVRHLATEGASPAETLARLNDALSTDNPSCMFVTLLHGLYDPKTGRTVLASGGHPPPLLRHADGRIEEVPLRNGRLLGYPGGNLRLTDHELTLGVGDTLVAYTDGFPEARAPDGETMFGLPRLMAALGGSRTALPLEACAEAVKEEVVRFTQSDELQDDLTLLLLRRR